MPPEVFCKKAVRNFIKKRLQHRSFPVNIGIILRTPEEEEDQRTAASEVTFLESHFQNDPELVTLQKIPITFKPEL